MWRDQSFIITLTSTNTQAYLTTIFMSIITVVTYKNSNFTTLHTTKGHHNDPESTWLSERLILCSWKYHPDRRLRDGHWFNWADTSPPSTPTNVSITYSTVTTISLTWTASTDNQSVGGVQGYRIFRNDSLLTTSSTITATDERKFPLRLMLIKSRHLMVLETFLINPNYLPGPRRLIMSCRRHHRILRQMSKLKMQ